MAKKKNYYYVMVMTITGPVFVTSIKPGRMALWDKREKPMELGSSYADMVAVGLGLNGYNAYLIKSPYELDTQPYHYSGGCFEWIPKQ